MRNIILAVRITLIAIRKIALHLALSRDMKLLCIDVLANSHQQLNQTLLLFLREGNLGCDKLLQVCEGLE